MPHAMVSLLVILALLGANAAPAETISPDEAAAWLAALTAAKDQLLAIPESDRAAAAVELWKSLEKQHPRYCDWLLQDGFDKPLWSRAPAGGPLLRPQSVVLGDKLTALLLGINPDFWRETTARVKAEYADKSAERDMPEAALTPILLYLRACEMRRAQRLQPLAAQGWSTIVFARHFNMGASHYAYTEGLSDAQNERHFYPGSALSLLHLKDGLWTEETLLEDPNGVIRDADVSWDGTKILFAWKHSDREDDYSLYVMNAATRETKRITGALGHADYEAAWLPNGDILFNSTRCVQIVDCWWTEVSNLYACAADGTCLRRLSFDQVHTNYPAVAPDGRVLYTRWDYNDRGQIYPQALFEMMPDGTGQRAFYGNSSWFPTTLLHARGIPGSTHVVAILTGHHTWQAGKLGIIDPARGREENEGVVLIAPERRTPPERIDQYGQEGELFKYPYPLDDRHFLVSCAPRGWESFGQPAQFQRPVFGLYFVDRDGRRELLYYDSDRQWSVGRMVPLAPRPLPHVAPSSVDYTKNHGVYHIQDIYAGQALQGIPRGAVKQLRVVALDYRAAGIGKNTNKGVAGGALVSTPIAVPNGTWDVKIPLGLAQVHEDGSALFSVPARTPIYFQALDDKGRALQSMRSWSTLQPGEQQSCVGCHDQKNSAPPAGHATSLAMRAGVQELDPAYGPPRGFSFPERIQPILDQHCIRCHQGNASDGAAEGELAFSLLNTPHVDAEAKRVWSEAYLRLTQGGPDDGPTRWISTQSAPDLQPPGTTGALRSPLMELLYAGHGDAHLSEKELAVMACWIDLGVPFCGDYTEANAWTEAEQANYAHYLNKRQAMQTEEQAAIQEYLRRLNP